MKRIAIIPCLNEEEGVVKVIEAFWKEKFDEVLVADGQSTDRTSFNAKKAKAVVFSVPRGKGNGFRSLLDQVSIDPNAVYVMVDGDYSYDPAESDRLLAKIREGADVVMGRRQILVHDVRSAVHVIGNGVISSTGSVLYLNVTPDICTGYWAFRGSALLKLKEKLTAQKFELEADLFSSTQKLGLKLGIVPISYHKRVGESKLRATDAIHIIGKLFRNRFS